MVSAIDDGRRRETAGAGRPTATCATRPEMLGGFFGVVSKRTASPTCSTAPTTTRTSARGAAGWSTANGGFKRFIHDITNAPVPLEVRGRPAQAPRQLGIGVISDYEDQPLLIGSHLGVYAIVTVGRDRTTWTRWPRRASAKRGTHFSEMNGNEINPTEVVATLINQQDDVRRGHPLRRSGRSRARARCCCSPTDGIYAARDRLGRTPGRHRREGRARTPSRWRPRLPEPRLRDRCATSGPGEIVRITPDGVETVAPPGDRDADLRVPVDLLRLPGLELRGHQRRGRAQPLRRRRWRGATTSRSTAWPAFPTPASATPSATPTESGIPYRRPFVKYTPTWPRSFMPQDQRVRDLVARMKLIPIRELIDGKRILFCEDSIVRGTQLQDIIQRLFDHGAPRGAHAPGLPAARPRLPVPELLPIEVGAGPGGAAGDQGDRGRRRPPPRRVRRRRSGRYAAMVERIRQRLGLTTLQYQTLPDMIAAIGLPREKLCTFCWNGESLYEDA